MQWQREKNTDFAKNQTAAVVSHLADQAILDHLGEVNRILI
jgi:hypothetical protein